MPGSIFTGPLGLVFRKGRLAPLAPIAPAGVGRTTRHFPFQHWRVQNLADLGTLLDGEFGYCAGTDEWYYGWRGTNTRFSPPAVNRVTNAMLAQMAAGTLKGNNTTATANALDLTAAQVTTLLGPPSPNALLNGGFRFAQRQAPGTVTGIVTDKYTADRWRCCYDTSPGAGNLINYNRVDTNSGGLEAGLNERYYGTYTQATGLGSIKWIVAQFLLANDTLPLAGRTRSFTVKLKASTPLTLRLGLIQLNSSGTIDTLPANLCAAGNFNSTGADPTLGSNLAYVAPTAIPGAGSSGLTVNGTVNGNAIDCAATTSWQLFGGTFTMPSNAKNIGVAVWLNAVQAANVSFSMGEAQFVDGSACVPYLPMAYTDELNMIEDFYEKTFNPDIAPATNNSVSAGCLTSVVAIAGANSYVIPFRFARRKWKVPTVTLYDPFAANALVTNGAASATTSTATFDQQGGFVSGTGNAAWTVGQQLLINMSAEAEL